jgi:(p)ppGpp synthase/HD superfamily hydrolase
MDRYQKLFIALRYYLLGKEYYSALKALDYGQTHHTGLRKDGKTKEFQHQVEIALFLTTLKNLKNEEVALTSALLHDVVEDYDVSPEEIKSMFGSEVSEIVWLLTKKYKNQEKEKKQYFEDLAKNPIASIVKGSDRIHNVQSMVGVFSTEKQKSYIKEVEDMFLPMIKRAKYFCPEQSAAYFNIEHMLKSQIELIKAIHKKS